MFDLNKAVLRHTQLTCCDQSHEWQIEQQVERGDHEQLEEHSTILSPAECLVQVAFPQRTPDRQGYAAHSNDERARTTMNDCLPQAENRMSKSARHCRTDWQSVFVDILARREKDDDGVVDARVGEENAQWQVVNEESSSCGRVPAVMEDEKVSLDRRPGEDDGNGAVEAQIDEPPRQTKCRRGGQNDTALQEIQVPRHVEQLHSKGENEEDDDGVIVYRLTKVAIG